MKKEENLIDIKSQIGIERQWWECGNDKTLKDDRRRSKHFQESMQRW